MGEEQGWITFWKTLGVRRERAGKVEWKVGMFKVGETGHFFKVMLKRRD